MTKGFPPQAIADINKGGRIAEQRWGPFPITSFSQWTDNFYTELTSYDNEVTTVTQLKIHLSNELRKNPFNHPEWQEIYESVISSLEENANTTIDYRPGN